MKRDSKSLSTIALHAAEEIDPVTGATSPSIVTATSFVPPKAAKIFSAYEYDPEEGYSYARWASPTVRLLEQKLSALENAEDSVVFASGMAAVTAVLLQTLKTGDHFVCANVCYPGVAEMAHNTLKNLGIDVSFFDPSNLEEAAATIRDGTRLVFIDTPVNPILRLTDIKAIVDIAHARGAEVVVDSTFATPAATRPLELGADYVMHSLTKYLNGHGDTLGGVICGAKEKLLHVRSEGLMHMGANLGAFEAWLVLRGLQTFWLRMVMHQDNAFQVAKFLEGHEKVAKVFYPGLPSHPQHELAKRQMKNFGGMVSFRLKGEQKAAVKFIENLQLIENAVSLGKTKSLIYYIFTDEMQKNSFQMDDQHFEDYLEWASEGVIRFSVGLENPEDLLADLEQALASV